MILSYPSVDRRCRPVSCNCISAGTAGSKRTLSALSIKVNSFGDTEGTMFISICSNTLWQCSRYSPASRFLSLISKVYLSKYGLNSSIISDISSGSASTGVIGATSTFSVGTDSANSTVHIQSCPNKKLLFVNTK